MFYRTMSEFQADSSRLLVQPATAAAGMVVPSALARHRSKVSRTATTAVEALMRAVTCETSDPTVRNPAVGYKDIWALNESACCAYILHTVRAVRGELTALLDAAGEDDADEVGADGWKAIDAAISALWELVHHVYPLDHDEEDAVIEHPVRAAVATLADLHLPENRAMDEGDSPVPQAEASTAGTLSF